MSECVVSGCAEAGLNEVLVALRLGDRAVALEVSLCDYHYGWSQAYAGIVNREAEVAA